MTLADELHYGRAASRLSMRQSPLSRLIKNFEADLGVRLFIRNRRCVRLTVAGEQFVDDVRAIVTQTQEAIERARLLASQ